MKVDKFFYKLSPASAADMSHRSKNADNKKQQKHAAEIHADPSSPPEQIPVQSMDHSALLHELKTFFLPKMDSLQTGVDTLTCEVRQFSSRMSIAENRISEVEDRQSNTDITVKQLVKKTQILQDRIDDLENRSRRNNLRIVGVPENIKGKDLLEFTALTFPKLLGLHPDILPIDVERAHRVGPERDLDQARARPRQVIFKCLNFQEKMKILRAYRARREILYEVFATLVDGEKISKVPPQNPGTPLNYEEYRDFFQTRLPAWKVESICHLRQSFGCMDPEIKHLDEFENHGSVPAGPVCAKLHTTTPFPSFCHFAKFRCSTRKYYLKRVWCTQPVKDTVAYSNIEPIGKSGVAFTDLSATQTTEPTGPFVPSSEPATTTVGAKEGLATKNRLSVKDFQLRDQKPLHGSNQNSTNLSKTKSISRSVENKQQWINKIRSDIASSLKSKLTTPKADRKSSGSKSPLRKIINKLNSKLTTHKADRKSPESTSPMRKIINKLNSKLTTHKADRKTSGSTSPMRKIINKLKASAGKKGKGPTTYAAAPRTKTSVHGEESTYVAESVH
ncbi:uncharacterized protein LOC128665037 [Bombina bombina]|uniref:uncharacterized protein LOC128665037 n=1 Tax=Bombina bombina TaxID=8345 RepID=UPI00235A71B3|nr:uncharacterized protein LOC128665037 [Bombina bombina]